MSDLIAIARELIDAFNTGDAERFKKHVTADVVYDEVGTQRKMQGADAWVRRGRRGGKRYPT